MLSESGYPFHFTKYWVSPARVRLRNNFSASNTSGCARISSSLVFLSVSSLCSFSAEDLVFETGLSVDSAPSTGSLS